MCATQIKTWVDVFEFSFCTEFVNFLVYFLFQKIYLVFLATFVSLTVAAFFFHVKIALKQRRTILAPVLSPTGKRKNDGLNDVHRNNARLALRFYAWHYLVYVGIASPVWFLDQMWCSKLLPFYDAFPFFFRLI